MENKSGFRPNPQLKLMDQVKEVLRYYHYAYRAEETYCQWILRYIHFYGGKTHPRELGSEHVERIPCATVSPSTCLRRVSIFGSYRIFSGMPM